MDMTSGWTFVTIVVVVRSIVLIHGAKDVGSTDDEATDVVDGVNALTLPKRVAINRDDKTIFCRSTYMIG